MKTYKITIKMTNNLTVEAKYPANNTKQAIRMATEIIPQIEEATKEKAIQYKIENYQESKKEPDLDRYVINKTKEKPETYICVDLDKRIKIEWQKGEYNKTQKIELINGADKNPLNIATALREMGEYLVTNHKNLL